MCLSKKDVNFVNSLLNTVGLNRKKYSSIDALSDGEKQRITLIRFLTGKPRVVLVDEPIGNLDEPTGNLDEINAYVALNLMIDVCKWNNNFLLLITHNQQLAKLTDKCFVLSNGGLSHQ
jgi:putative ABC transport system ATP-binding protein